MKSVESGESLGSAILRSLERGVTNAFFESLSRDPLRGVVFLVDHYSNCALTILSDSKLPHAPMEFSSIQVPLGTPADTHSVVCGDCPWHRIELFPRKFSAISRRNVHWCSETFYLPSVRKTSRKPSQCRRRSSGAERTSWTRRWLSSPLFITDSVLSLNDRPQMFNCTMSVEIGIKIGGTAFVGKFIRGGEGDMWVTPASANMGQRRVRRP